MARTECVSHAPKCWWWKFHLDYYAITGYDHCAASLLYVFEYLTDNALAEINTSTDDIDVWITITKTGLSDSIVEMFSERSSYDALKKLAALGFVEVRDQESLGEIKQYRFDYEAVSSAICEWNQSVSSKEDKSRFNTFAGKIAYEKKPATAGKIAYDSQAKLPTARRQNCLVYKEQDISSKAITNTTLPSLSEQSPSTPPQESLEPEVEVSTSLPPAADCDSKYIESQSSLYLDDDIAVFVKDAYKRERRITLKNSELKRRDGLLRDGEKAWGVEEYRAGLLDYLAGDHESVREQKWPIAWFIASPVKHFGNRATASRNESHGTPPSIPRKKQTDALERTEARNEGEKNSSTDYRLFVDRWNTLIPSKYCGELPAFALRQVEKAIQNPEFSAVAEDVFAKCARIAEAGEMDVQFTWLFSATKDGPNWQQLYMGKWDWAMNPKSSRKKPGEDIDDLIAECERKEAAERAAGGKN